MEPVQETGREMSERQKLGKLLDSSATARLGV